MNSGKGNMWHNIIEGVLLYLGLPLLFYYELIPLPKILVLVSVAAYCGFHLWWDASFNLRLFSRANRDGISKKILLRSLLVAITLGGLVWAISPDQFFAFPIERPVLWFVIMVLYPILSALPQEFIFRTYFFYRFEDHLPSKYMTVLCSAVAFSFLHIIYDNWWAIGLSFIAGLFLGFTYKRTRSLFWVTVEHAIYGGLVFALGMGNYFYEAF